MKIPQHIIPNQSHKLCTYFNDDFVFPHQFVAVNYMRWDANIISNNIDEY